ncbi:WD40 repeat domain-containing protein [Streptomyces abyssomicinicus]|uniref:WD40 repeat domain-containing protein n=1 Tax=Streptomyces abyssomicinicus TaxID=574929 RepID=UPI001FE41E26|nr:WD40 repeat domain-containing protein [Streptomyces abyssomicinicus]
MHSVHVPLESVVTTTGTPPAHASPQTTVAFSADGKSYATGSYDGRVVVWERDTRRIRWVRHHQRLVNTVRFSPSGELLASAGADKVCRVWRTADGGLVNVLSRQPDDVNAVAWIDENRLVTVSQDGTGRVWDIATGTLAEVTLTHADHCMSVDAGGPDALATCGEDARIRIWSGDGTLVRTLDQSGHAEMCRWSPDGELLAAACDDGYVHILRPDGELVSKLGPYDAAVKSVAWSPGGERVAVGAYDSTVRIWNRADGRELSRWYGPHLWPRSLDWSPDGASLIVGTISSAAELLTVPEQAPDEAGLTFEVTPTSTTAGVNHLVTAGALLASGGDDGRVSVWAAADGAGAPLRVPVGDGSLVNAVSLTASGDLCAYGTFRGRVGVLSLSDADRDDRELAAEEFGHPVNRVGWSADGTRLAVADYSGALGIHRWDGTRLTPVLRYHGHDGSIKDFSWLGDDRLVTVSTDRTAHLITADGELIRSFTGHGELVNSGSVTTVGSTHVLATASRDRTIRLYDLESGALLGVLTGHDESVKAVAWQPGGAPVLLSGGYDFTARLWTVDPGTWQARSVETLAGHTNAVSTVAWLGDTPVTGGWDNRVLLWGSGPDGGRTPRTPAGVPQLTAPDGVRP